MSSDKPRVSIGMPVYNGEKYIKEAISSILAQTFRDFELIISDNASTDRTQQICLEFGAKDSRIRYYRNEKNLGAPRNFNRTFELSSGEYFKWAAYDDVHMPDFLQKCINVLDNDSTVALCHSKIGVIDKNGVLIGNCDHRTMTKSYSPKAHERFGDLISRRNPCWAIFGVMRASLLGRTPLHGDYVGADRNLLAEIGLLGRFYEIPEYLFLRRDHPSSYTRMYCEDKFAVSANNYSAQYAWWSKDKFTNFPNWKNCSGFFKSVRRVKLSWPERLLCYIQIFQWFMHEGWMFMGNDIESLLLRRSPLARKLIPFAELNLNRTVIPAIKKMR